MNVRHVKTAKAVSEEQLPTEGVNDRPHRRDLLSTGSTLLNLACSENPFGGFLKGHYYYIVGDSASGKTFLSMTCLAEACYSRRFRDYRFIYDNVEDGCLMDLDALFGDKVADKVEPPRRDAKGTPIYSDTIEEFYYHLDDAVKSGKPFIYILDSMDGLSSESEGKKFDEHKKAHRKSERSEYDEGDDDRYGKPVKGSYGDGKAKKNSEGLRKMMAGLRASGSILIILSQTRDNLGFGFEKRTRAGGRALRFYATTEIWSSITETIKRHVNGRDRKIGVKVLLEVRKSRITGKLHDVKVDIYPSYGFDDLGSCVDYLVSEGWWEVQKQSIHAKEFRFKGTREKLITYLDSSDRYGTLRTIVGECWKKIEEQCALKRRRKYSE